MRVCMRERYSLCVRERECVCVRKRERETLCVCVCVCVCNTRPNPRGLTLTDTHRRTQTYFKIMAGQISTLALQLHTLRMQTLEMVKKHKPLNNQKLSALGIIVFRREQGVWNARGLQTKRSHGAILKSRFTTILRSEGSPHDRGMRNKCRLPHVAVFTTYSFQNFGSLHLVQAAASKNLLRFKPLISALPSVAMEAEVSHPTFVLCRK